VSKLNYFMVWKIKRNQDDNDQYVTRILLYFSISFTVCIQTRFICDSDCLIKPHSVIGGQTLSVFKSFLGWAEWCIPEVIALRRWRQEEIVASGASWDHISKTAAAKIKQFFWMDSKHAGSFLLIIALISHNWSQVWISAIFSLY
jgi:hypothetical protein